jgi:hypothetical protein
MMSTISSPWMAIGLGLHCIFGAIALIGAILFVMWAMKMKADELKQWVKWLLIVGVVGLLISAPLAHRGFMAKRMMRDGMMMMKDGEMMKMDQGMMKDGKMVPGRMMETPTK